MIITIKLAYRNNKNNLVIIPSKLQGTRSRDKYEKLYIGYKRRNFMLLPHFCLKSKSNIPKITTFATRKQEQG